MSTRDPSTLWRCVHRHAHMFTLTRVHASTVGGIGLQESLLRPQEHPIPGCPSGGVSGAWHQGERPGSSSSFSSDSLSP